MKKLRYEIFFAVLGAFVVLLLSLSSWLIVYPLNLNISLGENENASVFLFSGKVTPATDGSGMGYIYINSRDFHKASLSSESFENNSILKLDVKRNENNRNLNLKNFRQVGPRNYISTDEQVMMDIQLNGLQIRAVEKGIYMLYKKPFTVYLNIHFNFCLFVIIAFFAYVFFYMIFSYIFKLKRFGHNPWHDILFVTAFFVVLLIPASKIDTGDVAQYENRPLAKFPVLYIDGKFNNAWGKEFEAYFNDRFLGREVLNTMYKSFENAFSTVYQNDKVIADKKNGVFTYKRAIKNLYRTVDNEELEKDKNSLVQFASFAKSNGVKKVYVLVIPDRTNIYREDIPYHNLAGFKTAGLQLKDYLEESKDLNFKYIYPYEELMNEKSLKTNELYYKTDAHQTDYGGYVSYLALMKEIQKDYPRLKTVSVDEFDIMKSFKIQSSEGPEFGVGNANKVSLNSKKYLKTEYTYYLPKKSSNLVLKSYGDPELNLSRAFYPKGEKKVMLLGSSYIEKIYIFLRQTFKYTDKVRINNSYEQNFHIYRFEKKIKEEKPDVLVVVLNESEALQYIETMYDDSKEVDW